MKKLLILFLIGLSAALQAQEKITGLKTVCTNFERIEIIKMNPGTDMLDGLNQAVKDRSIRNGIILAGIGSVTDYCVHVVSDKNLPPAQQYPKASVAMDLVSVQGYILNSRVHAHIILSDENSAIGGHLEKGTVALTFFIITIGVLPDDLNIEDLDSYRKN
jgi:predicted DNA-binding protein with PD1-like motif